MKTHYWIRGKDRKRNEAMFLACKRTWRFYDSRYTRDKSKVTCVSCKKAITRKRFD